MDILIKIIEKLEFRLFAPGRILSKVRKCVMIWRLNMGKDSVNRNCNDNKFHSLMVLTKKDWSYSAELLWRERNSFCSLILIGGDYDRTVKSIKRKKFFNIKCSKLRNGIFLRVNKLINWWINKRKKYSPYSVYIMVL